MKRTSLAVFEKTETGWGAFSPDYPTGGLGETLDETRQHLLQGISYCLSESGELQRALSTPPASTIDFSDFDPDHTGHCVIEWLSIDLPAAGQTEVAA